MFIWFKLHCKRRRRARMDVIDHDHYWTWLHFCSTPNNDMAHWSLNLIINFSFTATFIGCRCCRRWQMIDILCHPFTVFNFIEAENKDRWKRIWVRKHCVFLSIFLQLITIVVSLGAFFIDGGSKTSKSKDQRNQSWFCKKKFNHRRNRNWLTTWHGREQAKMPLASTEWMFIYGMAMQMSVVPQNPFKVKWNEMWFGYYKLCLSDISSMDHHAYIQFSAQFTNSLSVINAPLSSRKQNNTQLTTRCDDLSVMPSRQ